MKVLVISPTFPPTRAGEAYHILHLCLRLADRGFDLHALTTKGPVMTGAFPFKVYPHYGVDLSVFRAIDRQAARLALDIPRDAKVLVFAANGAKRNMFKDYDTMRAAVARITGRQDKQILFIALGEDALDEQIGQARMRFVPYQKDPEVVARYYQAADLYLHAAKADTFPNAILEALGCGTPVVATSVGGVPEQIKGLQNSDCSLSDLNRYRVDDATGVWCPQQMPKRWLMLLGDC